MNSETPRWCGIENLGNTCFLNAMLQALGAACPELVNQLCNSEPASEDDAGKKSRATQHFALQLGEVLRELHTPAESAAVVRPTALLHEGKQALPGLLDDGEQHDVHELMHSLLETLHTCTQRTLRASELHRLRSRRSEEWRAATQPQPLLLPTPTTAMPASTSGGTAKRLPASQTPPATPQHPPTLSAVDEIFSGACVSSFRCHRCMRSTVRIEPSRDFSVQIVSPNHHSPDEQQPASSATSARADGGRTRSFASTWPQPSWAAAVGGRRKPPAERAAAGGAKGGASGGGKEGSGSGGGAAMEAGSSVSLSTCLREYFATEQLSGDDAYHCETCAGLQTAEKSLRLLARATRLEPQPTSHLLARWLAVPWWLP